MKMNRFKVLFMLACIVSGGMGCAHNKTVKVLPPDSTFQFIYIQGEFNKTGRFPWTKGMTLKDGIDLGQGFSGYATPGWLYIERQNGSTERFRIKMDAPFTNNVTLYPGDQVIIRKR